MKKKEDLTQFNNSQKLYSSDIIDNFDGNIDDLKAYDLAILENHINNVKVKVDLELSDSDIYEFLNHSIFHGLSTIQIVITGILREEDSKSLKFCNLSEIKELISNYRLIIDNTDQIIIFYDELKERLNNAFKDCYFSTENEAIISSSLVFLGKKINQLESGYDDRFKYKIFDKSFIDNCLKEPADIINLTSNKNIVFNKYLKNDESYFLSIKSKSIFKNKFYIPGVLIDVIRDLVFNSINNSSPGTSIYFIINQTENNINIKVIDEGFGIEDKNIDSVFTKGFSTRKNGLGMGLSKLYYVVVDKFLGQINLKTEKNIGTYFDINIPYNKD